METFDFPVHTVTHAYPKGDSFRFGGGYEFSAPIAGPVQRRFTLTFSAMQWFLSGETPSSSIEPHINILALDEFYRRHYTHKTFIYPHPVYGEMNVKFATDAPFEMPKSLPGGSGATEEFTVVFVEQST